MRKSHMPVTPKGRGSLLPPAIRPPHRVGSSMNGLAFAPSLQRFFAHGPALTH